MMRIGTWDLTILAYIEYPYIGPIYAGDSGWFLFRFPTVLNIQGMPVTPISNPDGNPSWAVPIGPGWNMVGNPFVFAIPVGEIIVECAPGNWKYLTDPQNNYTQQVFWVYINGAYVAYGNGNILPVARGGWVKKKTSGTGKIYFPATPVAPDPAALDVQPGVRAVAADYERPPAPPGAYDSSSSGGGGGGAGGGGCGCFISTSYSPQNSASDKQ